MTASMGLAYVYERLQRHRTDSDKMRVDALLDLPGAREAYEAAQDEFWEAFG
jgi:hypothetical protein